MYLVDVSIAGVTVHNVKNAQKTCGAMATATETRKLQEVSAKYHVSKSSTTKLIPFVLEVTGSFGPSAAGFVKSLIKSIPIPNGEDLAPSSPSEMSHYHAKLHHRLVERTTAALHRTNSFILRRYLTKIEHAVGRA